MFRKDPACLQVLAQGAEVYTGCSPVPSVKYTCTNKSCWACALGTYLPPLLLFQRTVFPFEPPIPALFLTKQLSSVAGVAWFSFFSFPFVNVLN